MDFRVIIDNFGYLYAGLVETIWLSVMAGFWSLAIGTILGMARLAKSQFIRHPVTLYIEMMRSTPLIMVIFWVFFFLPKIVQMPLNPRVSGLVALIAFYASNMAEIVRAGIQSIPKGQFEAASSSGLTYIETMRFVILPQAIRNMIPVFLTRFVALFMGTSLLYIIGVVEFFRAATIVTSREFRPVELYAFVALVYFVLCFAMSEVAAWLGRRLSTGRVESGVGW